MIGEKIIGCFKFLLISKSILEEQEEERQSLRIGNNKSMYVHYVKWPMKYRLLFEA